MASKTTLLEEQLLAAITSGELKVGSLVPSRNQLTMRYNFSRTTVERAIASLTRAGYLSSRRGSGTYVVSREVAAFIRELKVVADYDIKGDYSTPDIFLASEELYGIPVSWISTRQVNRYVESLAKPGVAVVWMTPGYEMLPAMKFLRSRNIPQLLINREFYDFDCVFTEVGSSIREGLEWLEDGWDGETAFIAREPSLNMPFQHSRIIWFLRLALEMNLSVPGKNCFIQPFIDIPQDMSEIGAKIFAAGSGVKKIFVLNYQMALPLLMCAKGRGLESGRDYRMLIFDQSRELRNYPGIAMMRQPYQTFESQCKVWLNEYAGKNNGRFCSALKTELIR